MKELDERDYEDGTNGWLDAGEPAKALEFCQKGIRYYPDSHWLHRLAAVACDYLRRYDDAIVYLTEAIRLEPEATGAYEYRATINRQASNYADSIEDYTSAIKLEPVSRLYFHRAYARQLHGDNVGAKLDYRHASTMQDDSTYPTMAAQMLQELEDK